MTFGELLRQERHAANRSLRELGAHLKLGVPYLSDVERGRRSPLSMGRLRVVASYFGIEPDQLILSAAIERKQVCPHCGEAIER